MGKKTLVCVGSMRWQEEKEFRYLTPKAQFSVM